MNCFQLPLMEQDLLHHMLQTGGRAACSMVRPAQTIQAVFDVELTAEYALVRVDVAGRSDQVKLRRGDRANHLHLRDFMHEVANRQIAENVISEGVRHESHS